MKIILGIALAALPLCGWAQKKDFQVKVRIGKLSEPAAATLSYRIQGKNCVDTSYLKEGIFSFKGRLEQPLVAFISVHPAGFNQQPAAGKMPVMGSARQFWLEPGVITIEDSASLFNAAIYGSKNNADEAEYNNLLKQFGNEEAAQKAIVNFIKVHPDSYVSLTILYRGFGASNKSAIPDVNMVEPLFKGLSEKVRNSEYGKVYAANLESWKLSNVGKIAQDFTQPDQNGKPVKLSDFKGKYVLVDFWASWCHPCRDENPNLIKQYKQYKDKGFVILAISLDGGSMAESATKGKEAWLKAIKEDSVADFIHVCDLKGHGQNEVRKMFGVLSIPENFLIDPTGRIIAKSLRGENLNQKLREVFDSKEAGLIQNTPSSVFLTAAELNKPIPLDSSVRTGILPNGFTYYIKKNVNPEKRVVFYLANKVGSILESDNERGLAHFLEHMNFNGTTNFPKNQLIDYLQKQGVRFGADINAYTGFDETVYQLPLPVSDHKVLNKGMQIMRDWAKGAVLDSVEIENERGVVIEEKRMGMGAQERIQRQIFPVLFNQSRYADRLPIGTTEVLKTFQAPTLRKFYDKWYRPDQQALIVVGDIDVDKMEQDIKRMFSNLKNPENAPVREKFTIPLTGTNQFIAATDPEQAGTAMEINTKYPAATINTVGEYRNFLIRQLFNRMAASRINEFTGSVNNPPFISGGVGLGSFQGGIDMFSISMRADPFKLEEGFKTLWREQKRWQNYGFTSTEFERVKDAILTEQQNKIKGISSVYSAVYANEYLQHFLKGVAQPGIRAELGLMNKLLPGITLQDMNNFLAGYSKDTDRAILITAPEKDKNRLPGEAQVIKWMQEVEKEDIKPYVDKFTAKPLIRTAPVPGRVVKEELLKEIGAKKWILSNGAQVILKKTDYSANDVVFKAFSPGGSSLFPDKDFPSAKYSTYLVTLAGVGEHSYSDISKMPEVRNLFFGTYIDDYAAGVMGGSSPDQMEFFLTLVHLIFTQPRFDKASFQGSLATIKASMANRKNSSENQYYSAISLALMNGNIRGRSEDSAFIDAIDFDRVSEVYTHLFSDAAGFTFTFVGAFNEDSLKVLVEKYLASLPGEGKKNSPQKLDVYPPSGETTTIVYGGVEDKAKVSLMFTGAFDGSPLRKKEVEALEKIIQIRLIERLREKESVVYTPSVISNTVSIPVPWYRLRIGFDCAPANIEKLIDACWDEINQLKQRGPSAEELAKFKAEDRANRELNLKENSYWNNMIESLILENRNLNEISKYEEIMEAITIDRLKKAASLFLVRDNLLRFLLLPQKMKK